MTMNSGLKGKTDHSTAGAQFVWKNKKDSRIGQVAAELMALCIASHHSGMINCLNPDGEDMFSKRMDKPADKTHFNEVTSKVDDVVLSRVKQLLASSVLEDQLSNQLKKLIRPDESAEVQQFQLGFLGRFLFSTLIDADRLNSAGRKPLSRASWPLLVGILEANLKSFVVRNRIDEIRANISSSCHEFAQREKGLFQLTVPTGGGKTLASLRFALHHAAKHGMDRIIYVVPYTSIIDQNARIARSLFAFLESTGNQVVLEHHSNLTPENDNNESKLLAENWDAPIIYTTAVQLLETLFGSGTRGVRRLHQLANAVIIFDEIQTIPIRTVHLFNNAINFLVSQCDSTVVFCTATQPLLHRVEEIKGAAKLSVDPEIMSNVDGLFRELHRAKIEDLCKVGGWTVDEVTTKAKEELADSGSVLIIVNKKSQAKKLYEKLHSTTEHVYHLSTSMCPAHRMTVLDKVKACLDRNNPVPVICVSTQLIECGVDADSGSVIRYLAGLDSIAQAAGRCNRNGSRPSGRVLIVNAANEDLSKLEDIEKAQEITWRILKEYKDNPAAFDNDLQSPKAMDLFYRYYFFKRSAEMSFPVGVREIGRSGDLFSLLSTNRLSVEAYKSDQHKAPLRCLNQSFMSAAKVFKAIDSATDGVIVPYGTDGERLITALCSANSLEEKNRLIKVAQRYSVNLFPHEIIRFKKNERLKEVWSGSGVYYLDERHYSKDFGVSIEEVAEMRTLIA